ncbi:MAG TPA: hypothetical protein VGC84_06785 [Ilumatobacteraceae bacterium]|jgi:hypothetical protein
MSDRADHIYDQQVDDQADEAIADDPNLIDPRFVEPTVVTPTVRVPADPEPLVIRQAVPDQVVATPAVTQVQPTQAQYVAPAVTTVPAATAAVPAATAAVRTSFTRSFAPDAVVAALVGLFVLLVGLLAITRGGFDGPLSTPIVSVLGFTHTTLLGLIEIVIGTCLLISGAARSRGAAMFFATVLGIAAFVGAVQTSSFRDLALESGFAWLLVIASLLVVFTALFVPRYARHSTVVHPV